MSLNYTAAAWEALAIKVHAGEVPPEQLEDLLGQMSKAERNRLERMLKDLDEAKQSFARRPLNGAEVVQLLATYIDKHVIPMAARMDEIEKLLRFQALPWYQRLWVRLLARWARVVRWLEAHGIQLHVLNRESGHVGSREGEDRAGGSVHGAGPSEGGGGGGAEEVRAEAGPAGAGPDQDQPRPRVILEGR